MKQYKKLPFRKEKGILRQKVANSNFHEAINKIDRGLHVWEVGELKELALNKANAIRKIVLYISKGHILPALISAGMPEKEATQLSYLYIKGDPSYMERVREYISRNIKKVEL